jgi:hypothetical protein
VVLQEVAEVIAEAVEAVEEGNIAFMQCSLT